LEIASTFDEFSHGWGPPLLPPRSDLENFDVLVIIPDHTLHMLPIHLISWEDGEFLATTHALTFSSSGTLFARCVDRNRARTDQALRRKSKSEEDTTTSPKQKSRPCIGYAKDTLTEKNAAYLNLARNFMEMFVEQKMTVARTALRASIERYRSQNRDPVICIVSHGYYDTGRPANSGMLLAGVRGVTTWKTMTTVLEDKAQGSQVRDLPFAEVPIHLEPQMPIADALSPWPWADIPEFMTAAEMEIDFQV
jgi:CHAT domain-containing protein